MNDLGFIISIVLFYLSFAWSFTERTTRYPFVRRLSRINSLDWESADLRVTIISFGYVCFWIIFSSYSLYFLAPQAISPSITALIFWTVPDDPLAKKHAFPFEVNFDPLRTPKKSKELFLYSFIFALVMTYFVPFLLIVFQCRGANLGVNP